MTEGEMQKLIVYSLQLIVMTKFKTIDFRAIMAIMLLLLALCFAGAISARIFLGANGKKNDGEKPDEKGEEK